MRQLGTTAAALAVLAACRAQPELPEIAAVPAFELHDQDGREVTRDDLRGSIWIANFMFTSCPDVCPVLTAKLGGLRRRLRADQIHVRYVSFSVDPEVDTPQVLKRYATERGADYEDWRFLTGSLDALRKVVVDGFKQSMQEQPAEQGKPANVLHGTHFVLIDGHATIRGFYRSDEEGLLTLARDVRVLLRKERGG